MKSMSLAALWCLAAAACTDAPTQTTGARSAMAPSLALVPLDRFGIGAGGRGNACAAPEYRQFDFWLGNWDIQTIGGAPQGGSVISGALGGCALLESYMGGLGRSLNAFDDATNTWHQFYVATGGGVLLLSGGLRADSMILAEQRGPTLRDVWAWTTRPDGSVKQHERFVFSDGSSLDRFIGIYVRRATPPVFPEPPVSTCARAPSRQFDFLLGDWDVHQGNEGSEAQGTLAVRSEAGGCLIEETLTGPGGFEALSYAAWHPQLQQWVRTYMDTDGRYIRLFGTFDGTRMVMRGNRRGANGGLVVVRVTWEPAGADLVRQRWEFSLDGGATFASSQDYTFARR